MEVQNRSKMLELNEVQPIDGYVSTLLRNAKEKYDLDIDLDNPTRGQRLEAALAMKDESGGFYSMELMVGRRMSSDDPLAMILVVQAMTPQDPRTFYEGFAHQYHPQR